MTATKTDALTVTELDTLIATLRDQVLSGGMTIDQLHWFIELDSVERESLMEGAGKESEATPTTILKLLSTQPIMLDATDGTATIPNAGDVFTGYIDPDFKDWGADEASSPTPEMKAVVHEMTQNATFKQMFDSLSAETKKLCMTQSQIIEFVKAHREHLRTDGYATFFLFKSKGKFFVAYVSFVDRGRLKVRVRRFERGSAWYADVRPRVVVPQL